AGGGTQTTQAGGAAAGGGVAGGGGAAAAGGTAGAAGGQAGSTAAGAGGASSPAPTTDPACDQSTGRLKVPTLYAPPCVPPLAGSNNGSTYQGVSASTIVVARPVPQPNAATQAILAAGGDTDSQDQINQTQVDYVDFFEHHYQTYGRKVKLVFFDSAVNPSDSDAAKHSEAQADATK